jgi:hypothetical protein
MAGVSSQADEIFTVRIENVSAKDALKLSNGKTEPVGVAPVLYLIHTNRAPLFTSGEPDRGKGLEALAEDGPTGPLEKSLKGHPGIVHVGSTDTPVGARSPGDIWPGDAFEFKVSAKPGERLTIAAMFVQSNDLFYAPREESPCSTPAASRPPATSPRKFCSGMRAPRSTRNRAWARTRRRSRPPPTRAPPSMAWSGPSAK